MKRLLFFVCLVSTPLCAFEGADENLIEMATQKQPPHMFQGEAFSFNLPASEKGLWSLTRESYTKQFYFQRWYKNDGKQKIHIVTCNHEGQDIKSSRERMHAQMLKVFGNTGKIEILEEGKGEVLFVIKDRNDQDCGCVRVRTGAKCDYYLAYSQVPLTDPSLVRSTWVPFLKKARLVHVKKSKS